jgi:hypothetical protein
MRRPEGITAISVCYFVEAAFLLFGSCGLIAILYGVLVAIGNDATAQIWTSFGMLCGVAFLVLAGVALVVAGWGLLGMKSWARWLAFILAIINLFAFPIGTVIGALIIWYLLKDDVQEAFEAAEEAMVMEELPPVEEVE